MAHVMLMYVLCGCVCFLVRVCLFSSLVVFYNLCGCVYHVGVCFTPQGSSEACVEFVLIMIVGVWLCACFVVCVICMGVFFF